jgi:hypothetical protein
MRAKNITGDEFKQFGLWFHYEYRINHNFNSLSNWMQPLNFIGDSLILYQKGLGPGAFISIIQAHILLKQKEMPITLENRYDVLREILLDLYEKIGKEFLFTTIINTDTSSATMMITHSREAALRFLKYTQLLNVQDAVFKLAFSLGYLEFQRSKLSSPVPLIYDDGGTVLFLYLLLIGKTDDHSISEIESNGNICQDFPEIGFCIQGYSEKRFNCAWINPNANIFIQLKQEGFTTVHFNEFRNPILINNILGIESSEPTFEIYSE